ncbi:DUF302 domain-containing protein [Winogradskyella aurantiaca]|uniref:DUF302 domain-containing protein n=1 Tax=Winogradskyella aurantiaca TaxID=2219558 RepID=UPI0018E54B83|nr:DUF302 domain-containing protein [Winogradskyella aurantiaca]
MKKITTFFCLTFVLFSCQNQNKEAKKEVTVQTISEKVTALNTKLNNTLDEAYIINLDHHKMAEEEGVYTPPAIATIFSDPKINTELVKQNPLIGLDLPFKVLCYSEADTTKVSFAYTSTDFISKRHGLNNSLLEPYDKKLSKIVSSVDSLLISRTNTDSVSLDFGIIKIQSDYDFKTTVTNLKAIVNAQNDTRWFGEIDFHKDAAALNQEVNQSTLLLFGGPAPGGKAMMTTPKIGLDAFCQKLLVYENDQGDIYIAFNDIVVFSELYYGTSTKPQNLINQRLTKTFKSAVKEEN